MRRCAPPTRSRAETISIAPTTSRMWLGEPHVSVARVATTTAGTVTTRNRRRIGSSVNPPLVATCSALTVIEHGSRKISTCANGSPSRSSTGVPNTSSPTPNTDCTAESSTTRAAITGHGTADASITASPRSVDVVAGREGDDLDDSVPQAHQRERAPADGDAPLFTIDLREPRDREPDHHCVSYRRDGLARVLFAHELERSHHPILGSAQTLPERAGCSVGCGPIELEGDRVVRRSLVARHAFPNAVVHIVQPVQDAQVGDQCLVGDDLSGRDGSPERAGVDRGQADARQGPRSVDRVLVALDVERHVPASAVAVADVHGRRAVPDEVDVALAGGPCGGL